MNRREFSDYYGIPYRTIQDWEAGEFYQIEDCNKMIYIGSDLPDEMNFQLNYLYHEKTKK